MASVSNLFIGGTYLDPDAARYIVAVQEQDGQSLEPGVQRLINEFVFNCKKDAIWDAIKACCILAGARTRAGSLIPLRGPAPTSVNFVNGDYDRTTGLKGNGSKYLDSNRSNSADPQDSNHNAIYLTEAGTYTQVYMGAGAGTNEVGDNNFGRSSPAIFVRNRNQAIGTDALGTQSSIGLIGSNRNSSASFTARADGSTSSFNITSEAPYSGNIIVGATGNGNYALDGRMAFYSIGESLDLAKLDTHVTRLITGLGDIL